jgi:hypothetical protein
MSPAPESVQNLVWSDWVPLKGAGRDARLPSQAGLYRIRSVESGRILYIGQTGRSLRARLGQLGGVYRDVMPYNDPHTVGPALWAHRIETGESFEVSVTVLEVDGPDRMGREALEITKQRILDGCSPAYNFGRMPRGWVKSSGNNRKLVEAGKRFRGYRLSDEEIAALPPDESAPPPSVLYGDTRAADWLGFAWRVAETHAPKTEDVGVYRISTARDGPIDYLGQGQIKQRYEQHAQRWLRALASAGSGAQNLDWVELGLTPRQLLEIENDLIASHVAVFGEPPRVQFGKMAGRGHGNGDGDAAWEGEGDR